MLLFIDKICAYMILSKHRVAKMRKVLQNGMSFANERDYPAISLRVRYYDLLFTQ